MRVEGRTGVEGRKGVEGRQGSGIEEGGGRLARRLLNVGSIRVGGAQRGGEVWEIGMSDDHFRKNVHSHKPVESSVHVDLHLSSLALFPFCLCFPSALARCNPERAQVFAAPRARMDEELKGSATLVKLPQPKGKVRVCAFAMCPPPQAQHLLHTKTLHQRSASPL